MARKKKTVASLEGLTIEQLNAEIERRQAMAEEFEQERAELLVRLEQVEAELAALGVDLSATGGRGRSRRGSTRAHSAGSGRGRKKTAKKAGARATKPRGQRKRHQNDMNLVEALRTVLQGKTMRVTEAAQAVQDAGYKTTSPNFRTIVNQTLLKNPDIFSKQGRGLYTAN